MRNQSQKEDDSGYIVEPIDQLACKSHRKAPDSESGFTLVETTVALVIILVALLGVVATFTYAIMYNAGNASRTQALATLQQEVELLRSKKFTPSITDPELTGGLTRVRNVPAPNGGQFTITDVIDDDPTTDGVQFDGTSAIKEITVTVRLAAPSPGWQTAVPATIVMRRTRGN